MSEKKLPTKGTNIDKFVVRDELKHTLIKIIPVVLEKGMEIINLNAQVRAMWEGAKAKIVIIDKEAEGRFRELEAQLAQSKDKTERLRMIVELINRHPELPEPIQEGIKKALENLTQEP